MSQNQSYFWQTTKRNVYLKRSAKLHMFLALIAVLTFSTICQAEFKQNDIDGTIGAPTKLALEEDNVIQQDLIAKNGQPAEATKEEPAPKAGGFLDAFTASISVILVTELGDKTFFIAAIMAMRHPRLIVFSGAISALALMTVLSVFFGMAATIIPKIYTYYISTALFAIFGLKMIYEGYKMKPTDAQEEFEEVQSDLRKREDELMRSKRGKYEDAVSSDGKRKNSNSDKEDSSSTTAGNAVLLSNLPKTTANPEMQHRQRKQPNNYISNNNNNNCDRSELNNDNDSIGDCNEADVFLENGLHRSKHESIKMKNFHKTIVNTSQSSPALSNQTAQTNCDDEFIANSDSIILNSSTNDVQNTPKELLNKKHINRNNTTDGPMTMVHSTSVSGNFKGLNGSVGSLASIKTGSIQSIHSSTAGGSTLASLDGNKRRLERNASASASMLQDPESGLVRKNSKKSATYLTTRVFMQAFTMTFLAEWGDRSQLTTIILGASKNVYGVITGGIIGHSICTGLAVIGGRIVAAKISVRTVTIVGGIVFLCFALYALIVRPDDI